MIVADSYCCKNHVYPSQNITIENHISILVIGINYNEALSYKGIGNVQIWATYIIDLPIISNPVISYYLTSNYSRDKDFFSSLQSLNNNIPIPISRLRLFIQYQSFSKSPSECIFLLYCLANTINATGEQQLSNSVAIVNFFEYLNNRNSSLGNFLNTMMIIYDSCEFDYPTLCITSALNKFSTSINLSSNCFDSYGYEAITIYPYFKIGSAYLYWNNYLEVLYCSISLNPNNNCPKCSDSCTYELLRNYSNCNNCNDSNCGYSNLVCIQENRCFSFMIGDGNCNSGCINDPDCSNNGDNIVSNDDLIIILVCTIVPFIL